MPGNQGGPAGAASSAFINDQFPEYEGQPNTVMTKFVRNPPVVFGTGYTQRLATEMTTELKARAAAARLAGTARPNATQSMRLTSKGVDFGTFATTCTGKSVDTCKDDTSQVVGVQGDLVVRPFQWGGIASSVRHFARDALDFHFSVQAVEKVGHKDCDLDGLGDEITVGNVSALTAYVTMFRPPDQVIPKGKDRSVARGRQLLDEIGCTDCHRASMKIDNATLTIMTPPAVSPSTPCPEEVSSLLNPEPPGSNHVAMEARARIADRLDEPEVQSQPGYYVTRVLWGIADTDPYLHDGRARTLRQAIELHGADGSEAQPAAARFAALSPRDQQALLDFLESLRLPIAEGVDEPEYVSE